MANKGGAAGRQLLRSQVLREKKICLEQGGKLAMRNYH